LGERLWANNTLDDWDPLAADLHRNYLAVVILYKEACNGFLKQIDETSECFTGLEGHYEFVEEKTRALQFACEKLLQEQVTETCIAFTCQHPEELSAEKLDRCGNLFLACVWHL